MAPTANSFPQALTQGPDGAVWFTEYGASKIGRITTAGAITEFAIPTPDSAPYGITVGPDGALWFTEYFTNKIGRITLAGAITEYPLPTANSFPAKIVTGSDGALWFTEFNIHKIGRITTHGDITEFSLIDGSYPIDITPGPDGALWFTESSRNQIGRITTSGTITEFGVPTPDAFPTGITAGPDGAMWFTEQSANKIGRLTVTGTVTEFPSGGGPISIVAGTDGALWFTENYGANLGRMTTLGVTAQFAMPTPGYLQGLTVGPGGRIWVAENSANRIGQVIYQTAILSTPASRGLPGENVTLNGLSFGAGETVTILDATGPLRTAVADASGSFSITVPIRPAPSGLNSYVASGRTSKKVAVAKLSILARLLAAPATITPGSILTVRGFGFNQGDLVDVRFDDLFLAATGETDSHGSLTVTFPIPLQAAPGVHSIVGRGANNLTVFAYITVQ
ncbi:MAG: hypothetical protein ABI693_10730 [Bryobacteraceae bacterium]